MRFRPQFPILFLTLAALSAAVAWAGPADDQYAVAAGHYSRGNWKLAVDEFETLLTQFPQHEKAGTCRFFQAEALVQLGQLEAARAKFAEFATREPKHAYVKQAMFRRGEAAYLAGQFEQALDDFEKFRQAHADDNLNAYVLPYLGEMALAAGDPTKAQSYFQATLDRFPKGPLTADARFGLARALEQKSDVAGAAKGYQALVEDPKSPLADDAYLQLATLYYRQGQFADAEKLFSAFDSTFPKSDQRVRANYWWALTRMAQRNWQGAFDLLQPNLAAAETASDPLLPSITYYAGESLRQLGQPADAAKYFSRVLERWPTSDAADDATYGESLLAFAANEHARVDAIANEFPTKFPKSDVTGKVLRVRGRSLLKRNLYAEAEETLTKAVEVQGDNVDRVTWYYLGVALLGGSKFTEAADALARVQPGDTNPELASGTLIAQAAAAMGLKQYEPAAQHLQAYLKAFPDGPDAAKARSDLALALARAGKFVEAQAALEQFAAKHPQHADLPATKLYVAEAAFAAGDFKLAKQMFLALSEVGQPAEVVAQAISGLAWCQLKEGSPVESAATFERLLKEYANSPLAPEAALARARSLEQSNQAEAALATYLLVVDKYSQSPQLSAAAVGAVRLHDKLQQKREAVELSQKLIERFPQLTDKDLLLYEWAWALVDLDRSDEANTVFRRLHEECPQSKYWADATYRLAETAAKAKDFDQAAQWAKAVVDSKPAADVLGSALYLQGQLAVSTGRWAEVIAPLERLLAETPKSPLALPADYWIAEALYRQGEYAKSGERFSRLVKETEGQKESWLAMAPLRLSQIYVQQGKWADALTLASDLATRFPDFKQQFEADYVIGRCLANEGRFDEARVAYERVVKFGGKTETAAIAQWMIGEAYFHQKSYENAVKAYSRVEILYDFPQWRAASLLQTGKCYEQLAQWKNAAASYERLLQQYPSATHVEQAKQRLEGLRARGE